MTGRLGPGAGESLDDERRLGVEPDRLLVVGDADGPRRRSGGCPHGVGRFGFVSGLIAIARATGVAGYVGDGINRWPSADTRDVGRLYRLALESAPAGSRLHAVAEEGVALRDIAAVIGRRLGVPAAPVAAEDVEQHFGYVSGLIGLDNPTSSDIIRDTLGWTPTRPGLLSDLDTEPSVAVEDTASAG